MSRLLLINARIICPFNQIDSSGSILIKEGRIAEVSLGSELEAPSMETYDCHGKIVAPGFIDLHTHLRVPGEEHKETLETGANAALAGGFTTLCAMPNTQPALDSALVVRDLLERSRSLPVNVLPIGAVTIGRKGEQLAPFGGLRSAGAVAFSDDGSPVTNAGIMRRALEYSSMYDVPIVTHAEELALSAGGSMHEGAVSHRLGVGGIPAEAEEVMVRRDVALARLTGGKLHVAHISTSGAVNAVREARASGLRVTAEVTPHHLVLTDEWVAGWGDLDSAGDTSHVLGLHAYDPYTKVNPPLRSRGHVEAVIEGVRDGTIDAIATDHAPHSQLEKECAYGCSAFGINGLEMALGLSMRLVRSGAVSLPNLVKLLTAGPARAFNLPHKGIISGERAELVIFDPDAEWVLDPSGLRSKSHNTPLAGQVMTGKVMATIAGDRMFAAEEISLV